jgi:hypothetical protein
MTLPGKRLLGAAAEISQTFLLPMQRLIKRYFNLPRREIGYLRFILESYDGLMFMRTLDASTGLVEVGYPPSRSADACGVLAALTRELAWRESSPPTGDEHGFC